MAIRLLLADDHQMLREGLRRSMTEEGFDVVGEARDGAEAVALAAGSAPEVILMDVTMPEQNGVEATREIVQVMPEVRVVMLTMHADQDLLAQAIRAGASGYLVKDCSTDEIADAVRTAAAGDQIISPRLAASMLDEVRKLDQPGQEDHERVVTRARGGGPPAHRRRVLHPRGGRAALHQPEDGEEPPGVDLPEARRPGPHPGRPPGRPDGHRPTSVMGRAAHPDHRSCDR